MSFDTTGTVILYALSWLIATIFFRTNYYGSANLRDRHIQRNILYVNKYSIFTLISFLCLFLLIAFRDNVGNDYHRYVELFDSIGSNRLESFEISWMKNSPAYWLLNIILYHLGADARLIFAVLGFASLYFIYKGIKELSPDWTLSIFIYFGLGLFYQNFNIIRQTIAVAILFWGFKFLIEDDFKGYIKIIFVGALFHTTVLVCLILWPLRKISMNIKSMCMYIMAGILFFFGFNYILQLFSWTHFVSAYSLTDFGSESWGLSTILNSIVRCVMFLFCISLYKDVNRIYGEKYISLYNVAAVCTIAQFGAMRFNIFGRLTIYFFIVYVALLPAVFKALEGKFAANSRKIVKFAEVCMIVIYHYTYYFSISGASGYQLYKFLQL